METATASAATTRPNQRLRIGCPPPLSVSPRTKAGHEVAHDFLKHGRIQPVANELALALRRDQIRRFQDPQVMRHRRKSDEKLLGDFPGSAILLAQELEDLAPRRVGEGARERVIHGGRYLYKYLNIVK